MVELNGAAHYLLGERKYTWFLARAENPYDVQNARWQLVSRAGTAVSGGDCEMGSDGVLRALMEPKARGDYRLLVTYEVGSEKKALEIPVLVT